MYQNNDNNNSSSVIGGNMYPYFYQEPPPTVGVEGDRPLQNIIEQQQQPLPQEMIHQDHGRMLQENQDLQQPKKPFLLSQQNNYLQHQNMIMFNSSNSSGCLNGN